MATQHTSHHAMAHATFTFTLHSPFRELQRVVNAGRDFITEHHVVRVAYKLNNQVRLYIEFSSEVADCVVLSDEILQHLSTELHCSVKSFANREWIKAPPRDVDDLLLIHTTAGFKWQPLMFDDYNVIGADSKLYRVNSDATAFDFALSQPPLKSLVNADVVCSSVIFTPVAKESESKREAMWMKWLGSVSDEYEGHGRALTIDTRTRTDDEFRVLFSKQSLIRKHWTKSVLNCKFTKLLLSIIPTFARQVICNEWVDRLMVVWLNRRDYIARKYSKAADDVDSMKWLINYFMFSPTTHSFWHHHVAFYNTCDRFGMCLYDIGASHMSALEIHRRLIRMEKMRHSVNSVVLGVAQSRNVFESNEDCDDARQFVSVLKSIAADRSNSESLRSMVMQILSSEYKNTTSDELLDNISAIMLKNRSNALECVFPVVDEFTWGCTQIICFMSGFPITLPEQFTAACASVATRLGTMNELVVQDIRSTCMYGILLHFWITHTYEMYERILITYNELGMGNEPVFKYAWVHDQRDNAIRAHETADHVGCLYTDKASPDKRRYVPSMYSSIHALVAGFPIRDAMGFLSGDPEKWRLASEIDIRDHCLRNYATVQSAVLLQKRREAVLEYEAREREIVQQTQPAFAKVHNLLVKYRRFVSALFSDDGCMRNQTRHLPTTSSMYKVTMVPYDFQRLRSSAVKYNALTFENQNPRKAVACLFVPAPVPSAAAVAVQASSRSLLKAVAPGARGVTVNGARKRKTTG